MAIVTIDQLKEMLSFTDDIGAADDSLLGRLLDAALSYVENKLGLSDGIEGQFGSVGQDPIPAALVQAVLQLAAHWFEHREGQAENTPSPTWVETIIREFREFAF